MSLSSNIPGAGARASVAAPPSSPQGVGGAVPEQPVVTQGSIEGLGQVVFWLDAVGSVALLEVEPAVCMHAVISSHYTLCKELSSLHLGSFQSKLFMFSSNRTDFAQIYC